MLRKRSDETNPADWFYPLKEMRRIRKIDKALGHGRIER